MPYSVSISVHPWFLSRERLLKKIAGKLGKETAKVKVEDLPFPGRS